jgi:tRNA pseudouridine65 synthase
MTLEILYRDEWLIAINKPHDLLVHRTRIAKGAELFALQLLRDQIGLKVYPVHRLDRKTGGVLLFGLAPEIHKKLQGLFSRKETEKTYLAIVRGFTEDEDIIDYPLKKQNGKHQDAITRFRTLDRVELDIPFGKHRTSRYSLLELKPETGRTHQIRKHLAHINHPIIADRPEGCNKQNKLFKEKFGLMTMMLHAKEIQFSHPVSGDHMTITADLQAEFRRMIEALGFSYPKKTTL